MLACTRRAALTKVTGEAEGTLADCQTHIDLCACACCTYQVGCGAGNTIFPCLEMNPELHIYACDFSPKAVSIVKAHPSYASGAQQKIGHVSVRNKRLGHLPVRVLCGCFAAMQRLLQQRCVLCIHGCSSTACTDVCCVSMDAATLTFLTKERHQVRPEVRHTETTLQSRI